MNTCVTELIADRMFCVRGVRKIVLGTVNVLKLMETGDGAVLTGVVVLPAVHRKSIRIALTGKFVKEVQIGAVLSKVVFAKILV